MRGYFINMQSCRKHKCELPPGLQFILHWTPSRMDLNSMTEEKREKTTAYQIELKSGVHEGTEAPKSVAVEAPMTKNTKQTRPKTHQCHRFSKCYACAMRRDRHQEQCGIKMTQKPLKDLGKERKDKNLKKNKKANALGEELLSTLKCKPLKLQKGHTQILNKVKRKKCQPKKAVLLRPKTEFMPNGEIVYL